MSGIVNMVYDNYYYYKKYLIYKISLYYKLLEHYYNPTNSPWWNEIIDGIILGAIPLKNLNHDDVLANTENVKYILTILDQFELDTITYISEPVKPEDWKSINVTQKIINSSDFEPLSIKDIQKGVSFLENCVREIKNGNTNKIYVHCKAGHGRSAIIVIAYLMKNHRMNLVDAHEFTKNKRSTINLNPSQYDSLVRYDSFLCGKVSEDECK